MQLLTGSTQSALFGVQLLTGSTQSALFGVQLLTGSTQSALFGVQLLTGSTQSALFGVTALCQLHRVPVNRSFLEFTGYDQHIPRKKSAISPTYRL